VSGTPSVDDVPDFLVRRPPMPTDAATLAAFDALFEAAVAASPATPIDYQLAAPRWQFICHVADTHAVVLHGSGNAAIPLFEPRQPQDNTEFGNRNAVYAASDGLWPMYFAILDRDRHRMSLINSSARPLADDGSLGEPYYYFSISATALAKEPWRRGTIYFLPKATFEQQPVTDFRGMRMVVSQWASAEPVVPLAKIEVGHEDFPLLADIRGHDWEKTVVRIRADPNGFPWVD
jgi:hypothetical protein